MFVLKIKSTVIYEEVFWNTLLQISQKVQWKAFANSSALLCIDTGE